MKDDHSSNQRDLNTQISNFISGLLAGVISVTVCNPLDIARTRLNVLVYLILARMHPNILVLILNTLTSRMPCKLYGNKKVGKDFIVVVL